MADSGPTFPENIYSTRSGENHIRDNDRVFKEALIENGINGELYTQAANSPDMNLLDLGFSEGSRVSMV